MAELYVDTEGLFEAVGEFDQEIKMCDQCIQALEECERAIQRLADSEQYQEDIHKLQRKIEVLRKCRENFRQAQTTLNDIRRCYEQVEQQPYEPDLEKLFLASLGSFGSLGSNTAGIVQMFQNGVDKKTLIGMTKRLIKNFGNLADEAYKENPDWKRVFRGKYELQHKKGWEHALDNLKNYRFSGKENIGEKIKVGTNWAGVAFSGILNAIDNYEEFGTTKSKRFWEETLLETTFDIVEDLAVSSVVSLALTMLCGGTTVVAVTAVTAGVIWAIDVANGYITEKSGGESKRAAEAVTDRILDGIESKKKEGE
ncbi:MAG: hypothetical protein ACLTBD_08960 [Clostridia bacterium]